MADYYFLASLLPPLEIGHVPGLGFSVLKDLLGINLNKEDLKKTKTFFRLIDLENFRAYWAKEPLDLRGNLTQDEVEQALLDMTWPGEEEFADYMRDFLEKYRDDEQRLGHFSELINAFLIDEGEKENGFLKRYFTFEREWRLVLVGFRAKKLGKNIDLELQYEEVTDPLVAQILAQKDAKVYEPPFEYKELKPIFEAYIDSPLELHRALYGYRFDKLIEMFGGEIFSIDRILAYMARLLLVEKWLELDVKQGIEVVDTLEKEVG